VDIDFSSSVGVVTQVKECSRKRYSFSCFFEFSNILGIVLFVEAENFEIECNAFESFIEHLYVFHYLLIYA